MGRMEYGNGKSPGYGPGEIEPVEVNQSEDISLMEYLTLTGANSNENLVSRFGLNFEEKKTNELYREGKIHY